MNKERVERLKGFVRELLPLLEELGIKPVLWGSFAFAAYTKDEEIEVNDVDFLVPMEAYDRFSRALKERGITYEYVDDWDCIQVKKDDLMIEFDPLSRYSITAFEDLDFGDFKLRAVSKKDLERQYKLASEDPNVAVYSMEKVRKYRAKYEKLRSLQQQSKYER